MEVSASVRDNFIHIVNDIFPNLILLLKIRCITSSH